MINKTVCIDLFGKEFTVATESLLWRPAVYGIVIKNNSVLLSKQYGDRYGLPGGGLNLGEDPKDGVVREVKEETGINVGNPKLIGLENSYFKTTHASTNKAYHSLLLYFACSYIGGKLSTDGFDKDERINSDLAEWIPLKNILDLKLASTVDYRPYINLVTSRKDTDIGFFRNK